MNGFIQWKGTDACFDLNCKCGELSHYDGDFMYQIVCPKCGAVYWCDPHINLIELDGVDNRYPYRVANLEGEE